jgi:hypothetical protein
MNPCALTSFAPSKHFDNDAVRALSWIVSQKSTLPPDITRILLKQYGS